MAHRLSPKAIAQWRYEQILEALGPDLPHDVRGEIVRRIVRTPVRWPWGETRPISASTLYRWIRAYEKKGLSGLRPATRRDKGKKRSRLPDTVVEKAFALWSEHEELTYTFLKALLEADSEVQELGLEIPRSTLQRRLAKHPGYQRLKRARKRARRRKRFVARAPHKIWQCDAKGPFTVRTEKGRELSFHVLTILDDASRAVLAWVVAPTPNLLAAVRVFRLAARRWGLPYRIYLDRASIFDSHAFREGLAELGSHRIETRAKNAEARGKIEAYHRDLSLWFERPLETQVICDLEHVRQLLAAVVELYQDHYHRGIKQTPRKALAGRVSSRAVSAARLDDAFRKEKRLQSHRVTGEVDFPGGTFLVPEHLRGQRCTFRVDPDPALVPYVVEPGTGRHLPLERAAVRPEDLPPEEPAHLERWGPGPLQKLYDAWRGRIRPQAEPGFGLPEVLDLLSEVAGRVVPRTDAEAALVQRVYRQIGPLASHPTRSAFQAIGRQLGSGRPLQVYLDALAERVTTPAPTPTKTRRRP